MTDRNSSFDPDGFIAIQAPLMGLSITGAQRSRVVHFLSVAHDMARVVEAADVPPDTLDVAGVFRPVGPDGGGR